MTKAAKKIAQKKSLKLNQEIPIPIQLIDWSPSLLSAVTLAWVLEQSIKSFWTTLALTSATLIVSVLSVRKQYLLDEFGFWTFINWIWLFVSALFLLWLVAAYVLLRFFWHPNLWA